MWLANGKYVLSRILHGIPIVLAIVVVNFFLIRLAPGDAAQVLAGEAQRFDAIARLADQLDVAVLSQKETQLVPGQLFVIGDETLEAEAGQILICPAGVPHKYANLGPGLLEAVTTPILLLEARQDRLVDPRAIERAAARLPNAELRAWGAESAHEILREADPVRDQALAAIDRFLDANAPAG